MHCGGVARIICSDCKLQVGYCSKACAFADSHLHEMEHGHENPELINSRYLRASDMDLSVRVKRAQEAWTEYRSHQARQEAKRQKPDPKSVFTDEEESDFPFPPGSPGRGRRRQQTKKKTTEIPSPRREASPRRKTKPSVPAPEPVRQKTSIEHETEKNIRKIEEVRGFVGEIMDELELDESSRRQVELSFERTLDISKRIAKGFLTQKNNITKHLAKLEEEATICQYLLSKGKLTQLEQLSPEETAKYYVEITHNETQQQMAWEGPIDWDPDQTLEEYEAEKAKEKAEEMEPRVGVFLKDLKPGEKLIKEEQLLDKYFAYKREALRRENANQATGAVTVSQDDADGHIRPPQKIAPEVLLKIFTKLEKLMTRPAGKETLADVEARYFEIRKYLDQLPKQSMITDPRFNKDLIKEYWVIDEETGEIHINPAMATSKIQRVMLDGVKKLVSVLCFENAVERTGDSANALIDAAFETLYQPNKKMAAVATGLRVLGAVAGGAAGLATASYGAYNYIFKPDTSQHLVPKLAETVSEAERVVGGEEAPVIRKQQETAAKVNSLKVGLRYLEATSEQAELEAQKEPDGNLSRALRLYPARNQPMRLDEATEKLIALPIVMADQLDQANISIVENALPDLKPEERDRISGLLSSTFTAITQQIGASILARNAKGGATPKTLEIERVKEIFEHNLALMRGQLRDEFSGVTNSIPPDLLDGFSLTVASTLRQHIEEEESFARTSANTSPFRQSLEFISALAEPQRDAEKNFPLTTAAEQKWRSKGMTPGTARAYASLEAGNAIEAEKAGAMFHDMIKKWNLVTWTDITATLGSAVWSSIMLGVAVSQFGAFSWVAMTSVPATAFRVASLVNKIRNRSKWLKQAEEIDPKKKKPYPYVASLTPEQVKDLKDKIWEFEKKLAAKPKRWTVKEYAEFKNNQIKLYGWSATLISPVTSGFNRIQRIVFSVSVVKTLYYNYAWAACYLGHGAWEVLTGISPLSAVPLLFISGSVVSSFTSLLINSNEARRMTTALTVGVAGFPLMIGAGLLDENSTVSCIADAWLSVHTVWKSVDSGLALLGRQTLSSYVLEFMAQRESPLLNSGVEVYDASLRTAKSSFGPERYPDEILEQSRTFTIEFEQMLAKSIDAKIQASAGLRMEMSRNPLFSIDDAFLSRRFPGMQITPEFENAKTMLDFFPLLVGKDKARTLEAFTGLTSSLFAIAQKLDVDVQRQREYADFLLEKMKNITTG